jgi:hypothetical protein
MVALLLLPAGAGATVVTFGSSLSATPTLDTANGATSANPAGTGEVIPPDPHDAADTSIWNTTLSGGGAVTSPVSGTVLTVNVKGCAVQDTSSPTQLSDGYPVGTVHVQTLKPLANGVMQVDESGQTFTFPFCGGSVTTSTVVPIVPTDHLCITQGESVDFNDSGGYVPPSTPGGPAFYPQGVPFEVMAPVAGSEMNSFIGPAGLGAVYTPGSSPTPTSGSGVESGKELLMQVQVGTDADNQDGCPGGGSAAAPPSSTPKPKTASLKLATQTDGVNKQRRTTIAAFCSSAACAGRLTLTAKHKTIGNASFSIPRSTTAKVPVRITKPGFKLIRKAHGHDLSVTLTMALTHGSTFTKSIHLKG